MKKLFILLLLFLSSCTLNIIQTDTHGVAKDVVDDTNKTDATADVSLPIKGI
jgi:hypothetical protein